MYFAVLRQPGPAWDGSRSMRSQRDWDAHATFTDDLAAEGFIMLGGPLGDGRRFLFLVSAESAEAVRARLDADPWSPLDLLKLVSVEPWELLLGEPAE